MNKKTEKLFENLIEMKVKNSIERKIPEIYEGVFNLKMKTKQDMERKQRILVTVIQYMSISLKA